MNRKTMIGIIIAVVVLVGSGLYWFIQKQPEKYTGPVEKVTLGVETSLLPAAVWVAEAQGYFKKNGLDVDIREFDSGKASLLAMLRGEVDISAAAPTPIMFNSFKRDDFSYFATFASSNEDIKLTARKDKGITTVADLKGKKIGTTLGTTGQYVVDTLLVLRGISPAEVTVVNFAPPELPNALHTGQVDAIVIWEPHGNNARKLLGEKAITIPISDVYKTTFNFLATNDLIKENPAVLVRFLQSIDKATEFIKRNKEESQAFVAARLGEETEDVTLFWDNFVFNVSMDQDWLVNIENEAKWAIKNNLTDQIKVPNYLDFIYLDAMQAVRPAAITIIR